MSFRDIFTTNLDALSKCTHVSVELVNLVREKELVGVPDQETLYSEQGTDYTKATLLYKRGIQTWKNSQFQEFLSMLERTGNAKAHEIITSCSADSKNVNIGSYEGYMLEDELEANQILIQLNNESKSKGYFRRCLFKSKKALNTKRKERLDQLLSSGKVWLNDNNPKNFPQDYIERKVCNETTHQTTLLDLLNPNKNNDLDWIKWDDQVLILLVDGPGMGKSCALTRLEQELRQKLAKSPRIIVRINLNIVGNGVNGSVETGVEKVIQELFKPLKDISLGEVDCPLYILMDGLDEVLPQNQESVLNVIRFVLSDNTVRKGWVVEKVVLTTRPHLKDLIESKFNVQAYFLVPLTRQEQVKFIQKRTGRIDVWKLRSHFSTLKDLMSNPLMLSMYCSIVGDEEVNNFDEYELYVRFMVKKHELYVSDKVGASYLPKRILKQMLDSNFPFYNHVALREILGEEKLKIVTDLTQSEVIVEPDPSKTTQLISFGVVVKDGNDLKFAHRSFAEFFYARVMTDVQNTPGDVRNALFAFGYVKETILAKFVSCVIHKNKESVQFLSKGWMKFVPEGEELWRYGEKALIDHIMFTAINLETECTRKNQLLIHDSVQSQLLAFWLNNMADKIEELEAHRNFLLYEDNTGFLASVVFGECFIIAHKIFGSMESCKDLFFTRIMGMSLKDRKQMAHDLLTGTDEFYEANILSDPRLSVFFASAFAREELLNLFVSDDSRVTDFLAYAPIRNVGLCYGEEFLPKNLLKFRFKFGCFKGKSLFQEQFQLGDLIERVWREIEDNIQDAIEVCNDDRNFNFVKILEDHLESIEDSAEVKGNRRDLIIKILDKVNWEKFGTAFLQCDTIDYCRMIAYGKTDAKNWERLLGNEKMKLFSLRYLKPLLGSLLLSAVDNKEQASGAPFEQVRKLGRDCEVADRYIRPLSSLLKSLSRKEDLVDLARIKCENPVLLSDLPSLWEVFFHDQKEIAYTHSKRKTRAILKESKGVITLIVEDLLSSSNALARKSSPGDELRRVLLKLEDLIGAEEVKAVGTGWWMHEEFAWCVKDLWLKDLEFGGKNVGVMIQVFMDTFGTEWVQKIRATEIPVQLLVAWEETKKGVDEKNQGLWRGLIDRVQTSIRSYLKDNLSLISIMYCGWNYYRECDWLRLMLLSESVNIPDDYAKRNKVYSNWVCSLLRAWIYIFGEQKTREETDRNVKGEGFWEKAAKKTKHAELLYIAVEIGSLKGVKRTAYPSYINWRDENNKTAVELAEDKLGKVHEVTEYLQDLNSIFTLCGLFVDYDYSEC